VNYAKLLEMNSFFTLHSFLEVGKTQDFPIKFWQTLEDALTRVHDLWSSQCLCISASSVSPDLWSSQCLCISASSVSPDQKEVASESSPKS
jgi:hypothetical protein